jgi:ketol-acid reductoisomerase
MKEVLTDIQDGSFARRWMDEYQSGSKNYQGMLKKRRAHPIEVVGRKLRDRMSWITKSKKSQKAA